MSEKPLEGTQEANIGAPQARGIESGPEDDDLLRKIEEMIDQKIEVAEGNIISDIMPLLTSKPVQDIIVNNIQNIDPGGGGSGSTTIFIVASSAGSGRYNCYEERLNGAKWNDNTGDPKFYPLNASNPPTFTVLNLREKRPVDGGEVGQWEYSPALLQYDSIAAWKIYDSLDVPRWVGVPLSNSVRFAKIVSLAGTVLSVRLLQNDGNLAATESNVFCIFNIITTIPLTIFAGLVPSLKVGDYVQVINRDGNWFYVGWLQDSGNCECVTA